jgi:hypothetical protein
VLPPRVRELHHPRVGLELGEVEVLTVLRPHRKATEIGEPVPEGLAWEASEVILFADCKKF